MKFKSDEELLYEVRLEHESIKEDFEDVNLGENWKQEVYSAKEQLASNAFVEFDDVWMLVAHGSVKDARCGTFMRRKTKGLIGCLNIKAHEGITDLHGFNYTNKGFFKRIFHSCNRPECPSCAITSWAVREALRAEARLRFASKEMRLGEIFHIIVSPPKNHGLPYEKLKRYLIDYLRSVGVVGGCYIYHHFRFHGRNETFEGERARYLKDNSHFHCLAFIKGGYGNCRRCRCLRDKSFDRCRKCNGFEGVVRRAYDKAVADGKVPLIVKVKEARKTVAGTLRYECSHASLRRDAKKKVVVNWFGTCARRKLKVPKGSMPQKEHMCPLCGSKMQRVVFLGDYKDLLAYMAVVDERNKGLWLNLKDKDGNWLWRSAYADKYRNG